MFVWYAALGVVAAVGIEATAWGGALSSPVVALIVAVLVLLLPGIGDLAVWWRHEWKAYRLHRRVRRWPESDREAIRTSAEALRAAWISHLNRSAVTVSGAVPV
jgi:hypothetical protein